jgi:3'-phosphoadenosine 5'-phosphosulfate sulfotransferase
MPIPDAIRFLGNCEVDSMDGHQISGDPIQSILDSAREQGYTKVLVILDAGYQFAVSIGVYVDRDEFFKVNPEKAPKQAKWRQKAAGRGQAVVLGGAA